MVGKHFKLDWRGEEVTERVKNSMRRAATAWGETVKARAKGRVHRLTGTLSRSLNWRGPVEEGEDKVIVEAGSIDWFTKLAYGKYERARGGSHDFLTEPVETTNKELPDKLAQAMREEGIGK